MIFAVDFDGTIVDHEFPQIGKEKPDALKTLKRLQGAGHHIIIWTCRCEPYLSPAIAWLKDHGFTPDAVNSNLASVPGFAVPKILADVYIDDRSFPPFKNWSDVVAEYLSDLPRHVHHY